MESKEENWLAAFENDLPSVASRAAIELDNLLLNRSTDLGATQRLADIIAKSFPRNAEANAPAPFVNPTTAMVVNRAIADANIDKLASRVDELIRHARELANTLQSVTAQAERSSIDEQRLQVMRAFCVALSRRALAEASLNRHARPQHPFRR
jgi:hypothetical protein